jgi:hypothetical protein
MNESELKAEASMNLPPGFTCADCKFFYYCKGLFECDETNTRCDWAPSRFSLSTTSPRVRQD